MDLQTVINFVSSSPTPPVPPTPGGEGELVNASAQTGDTLLMIIAMLLCVAVASVLALKIWSAKKAVASVGAHAIRPSKGEKNTSSKLPVVLAVVVAIFAILLTSTMVSVNSSSALAKTGAASVENDGPITPSKDAINAVVNEATGTITIEEFYVTNNNPTFFKFNEVTATKGEDIDDGNCDWKVYISNDIIIDESDLVFTGKADGTSQSTSKDRYIASKQVAYVRIETTMDAETAKSLIDKEVLSLKLAYIDQPTVVAQFLNGDGGTINHDNNASAIAVVPGVATYSITGDNNEVVVIDDGAGNISHHTAVADESSYFKFKEWTDITLPATDVVINDAISFVASFEKLNGVVNFDKNGGTTDAPASITDKKVGETVTLPDYSGVLPDATTCTGWNTKGDCTGIHYNFGFSFTIVSPDPVTLYADWKTPVFKAVCNSNNELTYYYNSIDYSTGNTVYEFMDAGSPKLSFTKLSDWGTDFNDARANFKKVTIDESVKSIPLTKIVSMFEGMTEATEVNGLGNLSWQTITSARYIFWDAKKIQEMKIPAGFGNKCDDLHGSYYDEETGRFSYAFHNFSFSKLILEADLVVNNRPFDFDRLCENGTSYWLDINTREALSSMDSSLAGTYTTSIVTWNDTNIQSVIAQSLNGAFDASPINSGDNVPSWANQILVKGNTGSEFVIKAKTQPASGLGTEYSFAYSAAEEGCTVSLNYRVANSDFNLSYIEPKEQYDLTLDLKDGVISNSDDYMLTNTLGWTKVEDKKYTKTVVQGTSIQDVTNAFPENVVYEGNESFDLNKTKAFSGWTNAEKSGEISEDLTFEPVWSYNVTVKACLPSFMTDYPSAGLLMPALADDFPLPGFTVDIPGYGKSSLKVNDNKADVSLPVPGFSEKLEIIATSTPGTSTCEFYQWVYTGEDGVSRVVDKTETLITEENCTLAAVFMPLGATGVSNIMMPVVAQNPFTQLLSGVNYTNAPSQWNYTTGFYTRSSITQNITYKQLQNEWANTTYSHTKYGSLKLMGWYAFETMFVINFSSGGDQTYSVRLIDSNSTMYPSGQIVLMKLGYDIDVNADDHADIVGGLTSATIPVVDAGTRFGVNADGKLFISNASLNKPGANPVSDDYDTCVEIQANAKDNYSLTGWEVTTQDANGANSTIQIIAGGQSVTITDKVLSVKPITNNSTATVTVKLEGGSVNEGMVPSGWTLDAGTGNYTRTYDSTAYTLNSVCAEWDMEDTRLTKDNAKFAGWTLSKDGELPIADNDTITATWITVTKIPIKYIYPNFATTVPQNYYGLEEGKNVTGAKHGYNDDDKEGITIKFDDGTSDFIEFIYLSACGFDHVKFIYLNNEDQITYENINWYQEKQFGNLKTLLRIDLFMGTNGTYSWVSSDQCSITSTNPYWFNEGIYLYGQNERYCTYFYVDGDNNKNLHIIDPISGFSDTFTAEASGEWNFVQWNYNGEKITGTAATPQKMSLTVDRNDFFAVSEQEHLMLNNNDNKLLDKADTPSGPQVEPQVDPVEPVDPQIDPVLPPEEEGGEGAAAAALLAAGPALAAFGLRKRIRGKHTKL